MRDDEEAQLGRVAKILAISGKVGCGSFGLIRHLVWPGTVVQTSGCTASTATISEPSGECHASRNWEHCLEISRLFAAILRVADTSLAAKGRGETNERCQAAACNIESSGIYDENTNNLARLRGNTNFEPSKASDRTSCPSLCPRQPGPRGQTQAGSFSCAEACSLRLPGGARKHRVSVN